MGVLRTQLEIRVTKREAVSAQRLEEYSEIMSADITETFDTCVDESVA